MCSGAANLERRIAAAEKSEDESDAEDEDEGGGR